MKVSEMKGYSLGIGIKNTKPLTTKPAFSGASGAWTPAARPAGKPPAAAAVRHAVKPSTPAVSKQAVALKTPAKVKESRLAQFNREMNERRQQSAFDPGGPQIKIR